MGGAGQHAGRPTGLPGTAKLVEFLHANAETARVAPDFIEGHEPVETIKSGVFHALGYVASA